VITAVDVDLSWHISRSDTVFYPLYHFRAHGTETHTTRPLESVQSNYCDIKAYRWVLLKYCD
jgi:hypothetical protein